MPKDSVWLSLAVVGVLTALLTASTGASAQKHPAQKPTSSNTTSSQQAAAQKALTSQLAESVLKEQPQAGGDYIPCKFTVAELKSLQNPEIALTLSEADGEVLKQQVMAAAYSRSIDPSTAGIDIDAFVANISAQTFAGLTPSEALNRVVAGLQVGKKSWANKQLATATASDAKQQLGAAMKVAPSTAAPVLDKLYNTAPQQVEAQQLPYYQMNQFLTQLAQQATAGAPDQAAAVAAATAITEVGARPQSQDLSALVDVARKTIAGLMRPPDVGCAMSIMSWNEVNYSFGRVIANEYIAIEVVVRNLSRDQEFILHDVEFEVNADPTGRIGRFYSGRDKIVVRALSSTQSSFDPRNLTVHSAQGVAALLSALVPIYGGAVGDAAAVFNAAFVPSLNKYWKDLSTDQLNLLNDTGFSSASSSQMVVPKTGTVMFVTFVPAKQFEEGWWTQPCVEVTFLGHRNKDGKITDLAGNPEKAAASSGTGSGISGFGSPTDSNNSGASAANKKLPATDAGAIDVARALEVCAQDPNPLPRVDKHWWQSSSPPDDQVKGISPKGTPEVDLFRNAYPVPYKKWSPASLALFRELSNTVVAGMHIVSDQALQPAISQLKCSADAQGNLIFPASDKDVTCTLTGTNLEKVAKLRLRNAQDAADTTTVDGNVTVSGDSTSASVTFPAAALHALNSPAYTVFAVSSTGVEQKTSQAIHLSTAPWGTISPTRVDLSSQSSQAVILKGNHLTTITSLTLDHNGTNISIPAAQIPIPTDTQITFNLDAKAMSKFGAGPTTLSVAMVDGSNNPFPVEQTIEFTGPSAPAPTTPTTKKMPTASNTPAAPKKSAAPSGQDTGNKGE